MKRKLTGLCLAVLLIIAALPVSAEGTVMKVNVPEEIPEVGQSFQVTVTIEGNPGLTAAQFTLKYDKDVVCCRSIKEQGAVKEMLSANNPNGDMGAVVAAASADPTEGDGVLCVYTFEVLRSGDPGFSAVDVKLMDGNKQKIAIRIVQPAQKGQPADSGEGGNASTGGTTESISAASGTKVTFSDVREDFWGAADIAKAVSLGLFSGYPDGTFHPNANISRADFVTVLWRASGSPELKRAAAFTDVAADKYYAKAVAWASENGYVNGVSETRFDPTGMLQRQAAMKILFAYSGGVSGAEVFLYNAYDDAFSDSHQIAPWAKNAMYWGYYKGLISGMGNGRLSPTTGATRAQLAKILVNYLDKIAAQEVAR